MAALSRTMLQNLALGKVADAGLLFENGRYSNAYYLYGYGIELGLKACIARQVMAETIPDKAVLTRFLTHRLSDLVWLAGLGADLDQRRLEKEFEARWNIVVAWSEESRYDVVEAGLAATMRDAVEHPAHGVMGWLRQHW